MSVSKADSPSQKLSYENNQYGKLDIIGSTIGQKLAETAAARPNDLAYKFCLTQTSYTFLELKQRVDELAQNLLNMGFKKGDNLALLLPNLPETALVTLAAGSIGVVTVLMNPAYQFVELEYMLKKIKAKGIFIMQDLKTLQHYELMKRICPELDSSVKGELNSKNLPNLKHVVMCHLMPPKEVESNLKGIWLFNEVRQHSTANSELPYVDIDDAFAMLFTSGTTGLPKAALFNHSSLLNTSRLINTLPGAASSFKNSCMPIPMFHTFGLTCGLVSSIVNGNKIIFPHIIPECLSTIKAIATEKCTGIYGAPTIYMDIVNHPERKNHDLSSLESMIIGAASVPKDLLVKLKEDLKLKNIIIGYAMTETGCAGSCTNVADAEVSEKAAYESIGRNFIETKIRDPLTDEIVARNTDGEICFRGYSITPGYYDDEVKTNETIDKNGWLKTGDIGCMDEDGYLFFKSRAKEIVIRGGINIYPAEVETFLRTHPKILDCYVIGIPDERFGEELCVWIKLSVGETDMSREEVKEFCKGNIAHFKVPKYVKIVEAFPVSATAKVQKFKMIDQMKKELGL